MCLPVSAEKIVFSQMLDCLSLLVRPRLLNYPNERHQSVDVSRKVLLKVSGDFSSLTDLDSEPLQ